MLSRPAVVTMVLLVLTTGCATSLHRHHGRRGNSTGAMTAEAPAAVAERGKVQVVTHAEEAAPVGRAAAYVELSAAECQRLAIMHAPLGYSLMTERAALRQSLGAKLHHAARARAEALKYAVLESQNRAAGEALTLYFDLAEAEAKFDLANESVTQLQHAIDQVAQLRQRGADVPAALNEFEPQLIAAQAQRAALDTKIATLNRQLRVKLGASCHDADSRYWPITALEQPREVFDTDAEVAIGLGSRAELAGMCYLISHLDAHTLSVARDYLGALHPMSRGEGAKSHHLLLKLLICPVLHRDLDLAAQQLRESLGRRQMQISEEIRGAVELYQGAQSQVVFAVQAEQQAARHASIADEQQKIDRATFGDVDQARLKHLESRAKVVEAVAGAIKALVQVKQSTGVLGCEVLFPAAESVEAGQGQPSAEAPLPDVSMNVQDWPLPPPPTTEHETATSTSDQESKSQPAADAQAATDDKPAELMTRRVFFSDRMMR
ncbi:MAG: TolC family protein [Planctomycetes bacterium]|nr:TolC family protein [Planctomycetota bacterium]